MSRLAALVRRLRSLFRRGREDAETRDELRFHLEMETEKNLRAGMDPREARRRAHARLGGVDAIREAVRDARGMRPAEDLLRDLGYALRGARRNPGFALAAVVSLAVPIGLNTTIFTIVDSLLFRPLPVVRPGELVDVYTSRPDGERYSTSSYQDYLDLRAGNDAFTDMAAHVPISAAVRVDGTGRFVMGEAVTGNYFELLGIRPVLGRMLVPDDDRPGAARVAVISNGLWDRAFGRDPGVVGRSLRIRSEPHLVVGVAPPGFAGMLPLLGPDLWIPMTWIDDVARMTLGPGDETGPGDRGHGQTYIKGRLRDGVTLAGADASLDVIMAGLAAADPDAGEDRRVTLTLTENARLPPGAAGPAYVIGAAGLMLVGVVLLVACANVMGMLLARGAARRREIGVRLAVGASRGRLVRQLLAESLVLSCLGAGAGLALTWGLLRTLALAELSIGPFSLTFEFVLDARAFLFTAALAAGSGVAAGLVPALRATRPNLVRDMNGSVAVARASGRRWVLRDALVALQLAVTVPLLVLAGLLARGAAGAIGVSPGFDPDGVAVVGVDVVAMGYDLDGTDGFLRTAIERVESMPGVEAASLASTVPLDAMNNPRNVLVSGLHGPGDRGARVDSVVVSADYFATLGVPLLQGRTFTTADTLESRRVAIVSGAMARRFWPAETAVGRRFRLGTWDGPDYEVVGVSADYQVRAESEEPTAYLHLAAAQQPRPFTLMLARTDGDAAALSAAIQRELRRMEPDVFFYHQGNTLRETVAAAMLPTRVAATVASTSGIVALVLGAIGLYGVVAYLVLRRTREFAVRSALGAGSRTLLRLVLATGARVAALGVGAGVVLTFAVTGLASQAVPGGPVADPVASVADPVVWAGVLLLVVGVTAAAHVGPARRILRLDLARALHVE